MVSSLLRSCLIQPIIGSLGLVGVARWADELNGWFHGDLVGRSATRRSPMRSS
jgi:hypothetical protein